MHVASQALVEDLRRQFAGQPAAAVLAAAAAQFPGQAVFSTSFGLEDQIITHLIFELNLPIRVFTLDTGRNFQETYSTWSKTRHRYGRPIETYFPEQAGVEQLLREKGPNSFYDSIDNRMECCGLRKVEPLRRALAGEQVWLTGIRAEQSANRHDMHAVEWDAGHQLLKVHPLFDWSFEQCWDFVHQHSIPFNPLHQQGFVSIGCAPCTRAIQPGEDFRAGRWWWEDQSAKECGLHSTHPHNGPDPVVEPVVGVN
ncbi:phosphoadenylyl-sulfate reductase [Hymenobacter persicinus]|uniref:Adenosine 5'-phosphosulfate reductase n=2 Tax=Hymenobacter persicinus TaxID=2025506 RepID=A0A4Q5LEL9_9BACT|nr:phosphoadenylyl-sulfate reductase [Hymenobacter persicinus]